MMRPQRNGDRVPRHSEAGFSLIEVMSALVILAIALTAVFATFISQQKSFTVQNRVAEMQQNLRQAVEYMSRDIRMAGYGIPDNVVIPNNIISAGCHVRSGRSTQRTTRRGRTRSTSCTCSTWTRTNRLPLTTAAMARNRIRHCGQHRRLSADRRGTRPRHRRHHGGPLPDDGGRGRRADVRGGSVQYRAHQIVRPRPPALHRRQGAVRPVFHRHHDGSLPSDADGRPEHPGAGRTTARGRHRGHAADVRDRYECRRDHRKLERPSPATSSQIRQVRLQFIARTRLPEAGWSETRPALGNRPAGTTADGYRRRTYDIVIDVRNSGV